jgi:hypothetical protein
MKPIYIAHEFYRNGNTGSKKYSSRPRVWFGKYAKEEQEKWIKEYMSLNDFNEIEPEDFMDRLFVTKIKFDWQKTDTQHIEIYSLKSEHFNHDCTKKRPM